MPVTVKQALDKGFTTVKLPAFFIFIACTVIGVVMKEAYRYPGWIILAAACAGILLASVYWYFKITKWRIWSYENVDHIHEFEQKAIDAGYLRSAGTLSDRLAVKTEEDKQKLSEAEKRFAEQDVYEDDLSVPPETLIYFSKNSALINIVVGGALMAAGIYFLIKNEPWGMLIVGVAGGFIMYKGIKEYNSKQPQIILNSQGVQIADKPFYNWASIYNDRTRVENSGKYSHTYFVFEYNGDEERINIEELDIDTDQLEHLLHVYRMRSEKTSR